MKANLAPAKLVATAIVVVFSFVLLSSACGDDSSSPTDVTNPEAGPDTSATGGTGSGTGGAGSGGALGTGGTPGLVIRNKTPLTDWMLQSSAKVSATGVQISSAAFDTQGWYAVDVPSTVVAGLLANALYEDPFVGMNLRDIPGTDYGVGENFSNREMSATSPFAVSWWYRTQFELPADAAEKEIVLHFEGINYRANIWVNGEQIADSNAVVGTFRRFEFAISERVQREGTNSIAVEVFAPEAQSLAQTFVDWMPQPPDKNMGLWREVYLTSSGSVALRHARIESDLPLPSLDQADLTVAVEVQNRTQQTLSGVLKGKIETTEFARDVELVAGETRLVSFSPPEFAQLEFQNPRLWWPYQYGNPELYELDLSFEVGGQVSDSLIQRFGIREMGSEFTDEGHRVFTVNGQRVLVRGAGWAPDMMFRPSPEREMQDVRFVKDMNLNAIRLEGKFESDVLLDACDEQGILVIAGWCCCDHWEHWDDWTAEDHSVAEDSLRSQVRRLRNHPSLLSWWNSSDMPPPRDVEQSYIDVLTDLDWRVPYVSSASEQPSDLTGPSGVKMNGPYDYVPPNYWWLDTENGGAWGFNTEAGPGPAIPGVESLKRFLGNDHLWPIDSYWEFHAGGGQFANVDLFTGALNARFGTATSLEDYVLKAQVSSYEGQRAMFEAFRRKKYTATGIVHWMLNNGWPSIIWHLYDYYHATGGGYFGTKKANEPLHVLYAYDDRAIVIANETNQPYDNLLATASVFNLDMTKMGEQQATVSVAPDGVANAFTLTSYTGLSSTYFVRLTLETPDQNLVSDNLYWLSTSPDVLNWNGSSWYHTPVSRHADLTALETLPSASVDVTASIDQNTERTLTVKVKNTGTSLAFFLELRVTQGDQGTEVLPTLWSDNYVSILPGEERTLTAHFAGDKLGGAEPFVQVQGWNVPKRAISAAN